MPKSICLQRRRIYQRVPRGSIPGAFALEVQDNTKDLEADADEVGSWVLAFEHKVVVGQSACDASDNSGTWRLRRVHSRIQQRTENSQDVSSLRLLDKVEGV